MFNPDFEAENFTLDELAQIANRYARQATGVDCGIEVGEIKAVMTDKQVPVGKAIEALWNKSHAYLSKGTDWGRNLADWAYDNSPPEPIRDAGGKRTVESVFQSLVRGPTSNYKFTVDLYYVSPDGDLVKK